MGQISRRETFGILHSSYEGTKEQVRLCDQCWQFRIVSVLKPKIIMPDEVKQADHDKWLQCYRCSTVVAKYETKVESKIQPFTEVSDNPHNQGKKIVGINERGSNRRKKTPIERQRERQRKQIEKEQDPDIKQELRHGLKVTKHYNE